MGIASTLACVAGLACCTAAAGCKKDARADVAGDVVCWGGLDNFSAERELRAYPLTGVYELFGTGELVCGRAYGGTACLGPDVPGVPASSQFAPLRVVRDPKALAIGGGHACAALADGTVRCWGRNLVGQLGTGDAPDPHALVPIDLGHPENTPLPAGSTSDGPQPVRGVAGVVQLAVGDSHTCARLASGGVTCWGGNQHGELGLGSASDPHATPAAVPGIDDAIDLAASAGWTCAVRRTGAVACWGISDKYPREGAMHFDAAPAPVPVTDAVQIAMRAEGMSSSRHQACVLRRDATVACFFDAKGPVEATGEHDVAQLVAGALHICELGRDGSVRCRGDNSYGQLGVEDDYPPPGTPVAGVAHVVQLAAGRFFTCARKK